MIVVTGGAGFIGSAFIAHLNAAGVEDIVVVDELGSTERWRNLVGKKFLSYFHKDEFRDLVGADQLPREITAVVHLGAISSTSERDIDLLMDNNVEYTNLLAHYCIENDIRFIYASSAQTYGDGALGYSDDHAHISQFRQLSGYGWSKQLSDLHALRVGWTSKIVGLKFFNVYGPNEYHKESMRSVVYNAHQQMKERGTVQLFRSYRPDFKDGEQKRDFIYVKDCCRVMSWLLENSGVNGIFNLGTGRARTWNELAAAVAGALDMPVSIEYIEMPEKLRNQYQYFTEAPMAKLRNAGYKAPFQSLEEGVRDYIVNYLEQPWQFY